MDLLYILGGGSKYDDLELRYSLRSIEANCTGYDRIFLVGRIPAWLRGVEFYPCGDPYDCTHKNMMYKILHICHKSDISDDFIMQGDDHFYVRPYSFQGARPYEKGELPTQFKPNEVAHNYRTSLMDTRDWLIQHNLPYLNGSQHCGQPFRRSLILETEQQLWLPAFSYPYGLESSTLMASILVSRGVATYVHREDCKLAHFDGEQGLRDRIGDNFCFSIYDRAFEHGLAGILQKWFPQKSRFEL